MPVYMGVNGVVREVKSVYGDYMYLPRRAKSNHVGVNGVVRDLERFTDKISRMVIEIVEVETAAVDGSGIETETLGTDLATARRYGSVTIAAKSVAISISSASKEIRLTGRAYIEYDDGSRYLIATALQHRSDVTLGGTVSGTISFNGDGWYRWTVFGGSHTGHVTDYSTVTGQIVDGTRMTLSIASAYGDNNAASMTFGTIAINGINFPIEVENKLS